MMKRAPAKKKQRRTARRAPSTTPVSDRLEVQWHRLLAIVLDKHHDDEVVITLADVEAFQRAHLGPHTVVAEERPDGLHIRVTTRSDADEAAHAAAAAKPS